LFFEREDGKLVDLIEAPGSQINWEYNKGDYTLGIKTDSLLRKKGIMKTDGKEIPFKDENGDQNVVQFYLKDLAKQLRGYPLAYSVINIARNHDTFADAITNRVVLEASMFGVSKTSTTDIGKQISNMANANKANKVGIVDKVKNVFTKKANVETMGTGGIFDLGTDESFEFTDVKTPSNNYDPFKKWTIYDIGMGTKTPPEMIIGKYESSFTAHKGALNDFIKTITKERQTFERTVMKPTITEIAKDAILSGLIEAPGFFDNDFIQSAYLQGMYLHPRVGHINPLQEVNAELKSINGALKLRSDVAAENGNEWDNYIDKWTEEQIEYTNVPVDNKAQALFKQESESNA
jgi:capsid protein